MREPARQEAARLWKPQEKIPGRWSDLSKRSERVRVNSREPPMTFQGVGPESGGHRQIGGRLRGS